MFILPLGILGLVLVLIPSGWVRAAGIVFLVLAAFCLFFFRDPERKVVVDPRFIIGPADGRVLDVVPCDEGPFKGGHLVRIFLSVFNVHIQRAPIKGRVETVTYKKGRFLDARDPRAHVENEQNSVLLSGPQGKMIVTQIAGLIARRIVCWVKEGDELKQGDRYGLIRFGSQVDLVLPATANVRVAVGEKIVGGETVIAEWNQ